MIQETRQRLAEYCQTPYIQHSLELANKNPVMR